MAMGNEIMKKHRNPFTLVELLIAVGLLSLIMMLLLQLFSGTQKIWIASDKTNNVYADARVAMELMADLINTVRFSHGETTDANGDVVRDKDQDMIFSINSINQVDGRDSNSIIFVSKTARELPMNNTNTRFISFRLNDGKLLMVVYSDEKNDFYNFFPGYGSNGKRSTALANLKTQMNALTPADDASASEKKECQVIAENVAAFKLTAYKLDSDGKLKKESDSADFAEPPYMIEIRLTLLDRDSYTRWQELSGAAKTAYFDQHKRTFTRNVFIGDRWTLEAQTKTGGGN